MIKDLEMTGLSWIIWMGPKYNHMDPYKIEAEGYLTDRRVGVNVTTEAETGVMPRNPCKSRNAERHQKLEEVRNRSSSRASRGRELLSTP